MSCRLREETSQQLSNHDTGFLPWSSRRAGGGSSRLTLLWAHLLRAGAGVDARDGAGLRRIGSDGNGAHRVRTVGVEASERTIERSGMPPVAGTSARSGVAEAATGAKLGASRAT